MSTSVDSVEEVVQKIQALPEDVQSTVLDRISGTVGIRQLMKMVGVQAVKAGTDYESDALEREAEAIECELYGSDPKERKQKGQGQEEMRDILATGPVYIGNTQQEETQEQQPEPQPPAEKPPMAKPLAWGFGGAALAAAITLPILAWNMTRGETPEQQDINIGARFVPVPPELIDET